MTRAHARAEDHASVFRENCKVSSIASATAARPKRQRWYRLRVIQTDLWDAGSQRSQRARSDFNAEAAEEERRPRVARRRHLPNVITLCEPCDLCVKKTSVFSAAYRVATGRGRYDFRTFATTVNAVSPTVATSYSIA